MKKILILASNPQGDLRIDREIRDLKKAIERNKTSEQFKVEIELAVRPDELQELFYENNLTYIYNRKYASSCYQFLC